VAGRVAAQTDGVAQLSIRAAGGVVAKDGQILLVHRPRRDDWSLPKGKLKRAEHPLTGAVREVREETGVTGRPGARLPTTSYDVWSGDRLVPKLVDYWAMSARNIETYIPNDEVDEIAWLPVPHALERLSYAHDRRVVTAFGALPPASPPVVLVRHAWAGERHAWAGPDQECRSPAHACRTNTTGGLASCSAPKAVTTRRSWA
jgi:8-oxo-dGTP diphosphatase